MKKYYLYKRQRYGIENQMITPFGQMPFFAGISLLRFLPAITICSLLDILYTVSKNIVIFYIFTTCCWIILLFELYIFVKTWNVTCCYCSKSLNDVESHRKNMCTAYPDYQSRITEIVFDDGWYMYFSK